MSGIHISEGPTRLILESDKSPKNKKKRKLIKCNYCDGMYTKIAKTYRHCSKYHKEEGSDEEVRASYVYMERSTVQSDHDYLKPIPGDKKNNRAEESGPVGVKMSGKAQQQPFVEMEDIQYIEVDSEMNSYLGICDLNEPASKKKKKDTDPTKSSPQEFVIGDDTEAPIVVALDDQGAINNLCVPHLNESIPRVLDTVNPSSSKILTKPGKEVQLIETSADGEGSDGNSYFGKINESNPENTLYAKPRRFGLPLPGPKRNANHWNLSFASCCVFLYCNKESLFSHLETEHDIQVQPNNDPSRFFKCKKCLIYLPESAHIKTHLDECTKVPQVEEIIILESDKEELTVDQSNLSPPMEESEQKSSSSPPKRKDESIICELCGQTFKSYKYKDRHSKRGCRKLLKLISCPLSKECEFKSRYKIQIMLHLKDNHNIPIEPPLDYTFKDFHEFLVWKEATEDSTNSCFTAQRTTKRGTGIYNCQRDGQANKHNHNKTGRRKKGGSVKTGTICFAMIQCRFNVDGPVNVKFFPTHTHPLDDEDLKSNRLPPLAMKLVDEMIAMNASPETIIEELSNSIPHTGGSPGETSLGKQRKKYQLKNVMQRIRYLTRFNLTLKLHPDDATQLKERVQILGSENYNPVLIYKPYGEDVLIGFEGCEILDADKKCFMLAIQTNKQRQMIIEGANRALVVGVTLGCTSYNSLRLLTVVVPDRNNRGLPVAHLISNRMEEKQIIQFFAALKEKNPTLRINCVVTDGDPAFVKGMKEGYGEDIWNLWCKRRFHQTLRRQLYNGKVGVELADEIYKSLCDIVDASTPEEFNDLVNNFKNKFKSEAKRFVRYFETKCLPRCEEWAMCCRTHYHGKVDTTVLVESFHKTLKSVYLSNYPKKRIVDLIDVLLKIEENYFHRMSSERQLVTPEDQGLAKIERRHQLSLQISDTDVNEVFPGHWTVKSQNKNTQGDLTSENSHIAFPGDPPMDDLLGCEVTKTSAGCYGDRCMYRCFSLGCSGLCPHLYSCSCADEILLCKHIHKVHSMTLKEKVNQESDNQNYYEIVYSDDNLSNDLPYQVEEDYTTTSIIMNTEHHNEELFSLMNDIKGYMENEFLRINCLPHVLTTMRKLKGFLESEEKGLRLK